MLHSLNLTAALVPVRFDTFTGQPVADARKRDGALPKGMQPLSIGLDQPGALVENNPPGETLKNFESTAPAEGGKPSNLANPNQSRTPQQQRESGESTSSEDGAPPRDGASPTGAPPSASGQKETAPPRPDQKRDGLLDKMRDALASLMDKLKMESQGGSGSDKSSNPNGAQQEAQQRRESKGPPNQGKPQAGEAQGQQSQQQSDAAQAGQSAQSDSASAADSNQQKSGVGRQDGSKEIDAAKEAEALGKLSELIGKRSMNLQGEVMVEVESTHNPQVRTPYLQRGAAHSESGGDLSRDEVPLRHQEFVKRYYEQLRRQPDSLPPGPAKSPQQP